MKRIWKILGTLGIIASLVLVSILISWKATERARLQYAAAQAEYAAYRKELAEAIREKTALSDKLDKIGSDSKKNGAQVLWFLEREVLLLKELRLLAQSVDVLIKNTDEPATLGQAYRMSESLERIHKSRVNR